MQVIGYHGTNNKFDKFTLDNFGTNDFGYLGKGIYLTNDLEMAQSYADGEQGRLLKVKATITNPYIITDWKYSYHPEKLRQELECRNALQINNKLIEQGYDSVMLKYTDDYGEEFMELCVFNPDNVEIIEEMYEIYNESITLNEQSLHKSKANSLEDFEQQIQQFRLSNDIKLKQLISKLYYEIPNVGVGIPASTYRHDDKKHQVTNNDWKGLIKNIKHPSLYVEAKHAKAFRGINYLYKYHFYNNYYGVGVCKCKNVDLITTFFKDHENSIDNWLQGNGKAQPEVPTANYVPGCSLSEELPINSITNFDNYVNLLEDIIKQALEEDFKSWFKGSKVVDNNGDPLIVYHGTSAEFDTFDNSVNQDKTRQMGADLGYFFTDNETVARRFIPKRQTNKPQINLDGTNFKNEQEFEEFKIDFENAMQTNDWKSIKDKYSNFFDLRDDYMEVQSKLNVKEDPQAYGLKQCYLQMRNPRYIDGDIIGTGVDREYFLQSSKENGYDGVIIKDADTGAGFANEYIVFKPNQIKSIDAKSFSNSDNIYEEFSMTTTGMSDYDASLNYNDYARETKGRFSEIFLMAPDEYINLCDYGFSQTNQEHTKQKMLDSRYYDKQDIEDLKNKLQNDTIDMLTLEFGMENGTIKHFTQEGLHRAIAAKELDMKEIPVLVMFSGEKGLKALKRFAKNFKQVSNNWTDYKFKNKWKNASDLYEFKYLNEKLEGIINGF